MTFTYCVVVLLLLSSSLAQNIYPSTTSPVDQQSTTPQFLVLSIEDRLDTALYRHMLSLVPEVKAQEGRERLNQCDVPFTWFVSSIESDQLTVQIAHSRNVDIAVAINGVSDSNVQERVTSARSYLQSLEIPSEDIQGITFDQVTQSLEARQTASNAGFAYDYSTRMETRFYPYTMDNVGILSVDCTDPEACSTTERLPGYLQIPRYAMQDVQTQRYVSDAEFYSSQRLVSALDAAFLAAYNGNRAPLTLRLTRELLENEETLRELRNFLRGALGFVDVYLASYKQLNEWMRNPVGSGTQLEEMLQCRESSNFATECYPPTGGCQRGTYDYAACSCVCEGTAGGAGYCVDQRGACTRQSEFNETTSSFECVEIEDECEGETCEVEGGASTEKDKVVLTNPTTWDLYTFLIVVAIGFVGSMICLYLGIKQGRVKRQILVEVPPTPSVAKTRAIRGKRASLPPPPPPQLEGIEVIPNNEN